jgi:hypothetical protein
MAKSFAVMERVNPWGERKWCFCFGTDRTVTGVGLENRRWWDSKGELADALTELGIEPEKYDVIPA